VVSEEPPSVRARLGLIIPSSNRLSEPQFRRYAPPGVEPHVTRLRMTGPHHTPLAELLPRIEEAAGALGDARCDIVVFHCTASSMEAGLDGERGVVELIQRATGRPACSTATAVLAAFEALGARKLVLVTPYTQQANDHEIAFLVQAGLEVVRDRALALGGSDGYVSAPPALWLRAVDEERDPRAEAYFVSCTNIRSLEVIAELEARLGRPVVASNQATLWYCLRTLGLADRVPGLGVLLDSPLPALPVTQAWLSAG
jgi:maleate cis-trans isomerase